MQSVELEDLDPCVEVAWCVCADAAGGTGAADIGFRETACEVEIGSACGGEVSFEALLVEDLGAGVGKEECCSGWGLACDMGGWEMEGDEQVNDDVGVNVTFDSAVSILDYLFPDDAITDFGDEVAPFLSAEGGFALFAVELNNGV